MYSSVMGFTIMTNNSPITLGQLIYDLCNFVFENPDRAKLPVVINVPCWNYNENGKDQEALRVQGKPEFVKLDANNTWPGYNELTGTMIHFEDMIRIYDSPDGRL